MPVRPSTAARVAAPVAFLVGVTILVLLVRSALDAGEPVASSETAAVETQPPQETQPAAEAEEEAQPPPQRPARTQPARTQPAETQPAETQPAESPTYYVIQSGDTLEAIAQRHDTTVERLLELNPGIDPVALTVGERIRVS